MLKRPHYIALGLVVLLTLVILNLPSQTTARLKLGIGSLFLPLFGLASSTQQLAGATGDAVVPRRELLKLNEGLAPGKPAVAAAGHAGARKRPGKTPGCGSSSGWQRQTPWKLKLAQGGPARPGQLVAHGPD